MTPPHVHEWVDCIVGCDDCGEHPAVRCDGEGDCEFAEPVDLIRHDDPRENGDGDGPG